MVQIASLLDTGDMHLKGLLGSIVRVGCRIPVPDFYLVLHGLRCRESTIVDNNLKPNNLHNNCKYGMTISEILHERRRDVLCKF